MFPLVLLLALSRTATVFSVMPVAALTVSWEPDRTARLPAEETEPVLLVRVTAGPAREVTTMLPVAVALMAIPVAVEETPDWKMLPPPALVDCKVTWPVAPATILPNWRLPAALAPAVKKTLPPLVFRLLAVKPVPAVKTS